MTTLTVGQASGVIAAVVLAVQTFLPLAIVIVLVSLIHADQTAATWSVIGKSVQSSWWPTILRTDSATTINVSRRVTLLTWLSTLGYVILGIAGVVTPLGLSDSIRPDGTVQTEFRYVQDQSPFGYGTPPRYTNFSRFCGDLLPVNCPGRSDGYKNPEVFPNGTISVDPTDNDSYFNSTLPENITEVFSSATDGTTLSGPFDIQYRTWELTFDKEDTVADRGQPYSAGSYRSLDSLVLHNTVEAVEGVIADSIDGGIGYRNHTVPSNLPYGGEWSEEILWIEPVTECADTNLTFEIHVGDYAGNITSLDLVDNGGFVDHPQHIDLDTRPSQDLDLRERALMGALLSNRLLMLHFKVKDPNDTRPWNSIMGQRFPLNVTNTLLLVPLYTMQLTQLTPNFYHLEPFGSDSYYGGNSTTIPTGNTSDDWQMVQDFCQGGSDIRQANTSNIALICGYLYGAPTPTYPDDRLIFRPYSTWKQSLYVCSSSIRAGVKVVSFSSNGTQSLESLHITDVRDKAYADLASAPLWAVERTYKDLFEASALWGPVAEKYSASPDLTTYRAPKFFLPAISSQRTITGSGHSLAATDVFIAALMGVYESYYPGGPLADYSGQASAALRSKWQTLSQAAATASKIVNLIYTDLLATATVGTKSAQRPENSAASSGAAVQRAGPPRPPKVTMYNRRLQYNYLYGIPAAIILFITIATAIVLLLCLVFRFKYKAFVQLLNQTSTGRIITNLIYPEVSQPDVKTKTWAKMAGGTKLKYPFHTALEEDQPATPVSMSEVNPEGVSTDEVTQLQESQASTQNGGSQVVESGVYSEQEHDVSHGDDVSQRRPLIASPSPSPMEDEAAKREGMQVQVWQL